MADSYFGKGIPLASGFDLGAKLPLDSRISVDTFSELDSHVKNNRAFPGLTVYVKDRDENYQYDGKNWVLFGRGSVSTVIVDKYEDIAKLTNVGQGALIYVKSDSNKNDEENMYVVTKDKLVNGTVTPETYVALSTFAKSLVPTLKYDESLPEGKKIYMNRDEEFILKFFFSSDSFGDGKYKIYKNGSLIKSFNAAKGNVLVNLGGFDTNGDYTIEVAAADYFGTPAPKNLEYKIIVGGLELTSTFEETLSVAIFEIGDDIPVQYNATVSDKDQKIKMLFTVTDPDGKVSTDLLETNASEVSSTWSNKNLFTTRGLYNLKIRSYTGTSLNDTTEGTFISNELSYNFRVLQEKEIGIMSELDGQIDTNTYVSIPFKVFRKNTSMLAMRGKLERNVNGTWKEYASTGNEGLMVNCNLMHYWSIGRLPEGEYRYELWGYTTDFEEKSISPVKQSFTVTLSSYKPKQPATTGLIAWFDANDKRNNDSDKNIWKNKKDSGLADTFRIELHDLNYDENGWKNIDGLPDNVNGEFILKMNGQSWGQMVKVNYDQTTSPYSPFSIFSKGGGTGITLETSIKARCNGDLNAKVMTCMEGRSSSSPGISIGYNKFCISSALQPMSMDFMEDEWVHVTFVVDSEIRNLYGEGGVTQDEIENLNPARTLRIYINGVLCSCNTITSKDTFLDSVGASFPLMLNSCLIDNETVDNFGDSEIKFIRIYNRPLKASEVVDNYVSHFFGQEKQQQMADRNDPSIVCLPKIIFRKKDNSPATFSRLHGIVDKAESKKVFVECDMEFQKVDGTSDFYYDTSVYLQGTSSLQYPVKNYKIKKYTAPLGSPDRKKDPFIPPEKEGVWKGDYTYTLKVDYMEQSHMNNTPTARFYDKVIDALGGKSPARQAGFRDSIDGFPCIVYYDDNPGGPESKEVLVGSFMFNIDKEGMDLGFDLDGCKDENGVALPNKCISYEGTANTSDTAGCFFELGDNLEKVYNYYIESSFKEYAKENKIPESSSNFDSFKEQINAGKLPQYKTFEQYSKDYTEIDYIISDFEARYSYCEDDEEATYQPMVDLVNWVSSCWEKQTNGEFKLNRKKFEEGFNTHFDMTYMMAYYLQMQVFAQVDNCGKNAMWDTWDGVKFYPRPYDMDTEMGLSNTGTEIIRPDAEIIPSLSPTKATGHDWAAYSNSTRDGEDRYLMYNTKTSRLWNAFAEVYADDIAETYIKLRDNKTYTVDNILDFVRSMTVDKIGEIYYNKDAASKYLSITTEDESGYLSMLHGNRQQKYKRFLTERIIFLDTVYGYMWTVDGVNKDKEGKTLNSETRMRSDAAYDINTGATETIQCHLGIAVYSPQYVTVSVGSGKDAVITAFVSPTSRYIDPNTGVEKEGTLFSFPVAGSNKEVGVFGSGNIKRIDRLETLDLTEIAAERLVKILAFNFSGATRLSVLSLGKNTYLRELDCSRAMNLGTEDKGKTLDLTNCKNLVSLNASTTKITGVAFPKNTNLIDCDLSYTNITGINIDGAEFLKTIKITGCEDIADFSLNRCNKLEVLDVSRSAIKNCKATNCTVMKTVNVSNCSQLQAFDVSNSDMIEELIMTGNSGNVMKDLQLYSLYSLKKLVVNDSTTVNTIKLPKFKNLEEAAKGDKGEKWNNLGYLDIRNSTVKRIQYGSSESAAEICDMSQLSNLTELYCSGAFAMTNMESLNYTAKNGVQSLFSGCNSLKRISGEIRTTQANANYIFNECHYLSDISELTFKFGPLDDNGNVIKPCITSAAYAFRHCIKATSAMLKKFLDACGTSLKNIDYFIYMWGVKGLDESVTRDNAVIGTKPDRTNRDIPYDLFVKTPNIESMVAAFLETHYTTIPGTLFDPIKSTLKNLNQTFCHADKLTTVGKDLLKNMKALENCYGTFAKCYNLKTYLSEDPNIFEFTGDNAKYNSKITTTNQMFFNCYNLTLGDKGIGKLFDPLTAATTFEFMFYNCKAMSMTLPNGIFSKNLKLTRLDGVFSSCAGIKNVPDRLFRVNANDTNTLTNLKQARNVFAGCSGMKGMVKKSFFEGAPKLTDISNANNTVEVFSGGGIIGVSTGFFGNTNIDSYHEGILSCMPELTSVAYLFNHTSANNSLKYCYKTGSSGDEVYLYSVSPKIFEKNKALQSTAGMFRNNTGMTGFIPPKLFDPCRKSIMNVGYMFNGCTSLNGSENDVTNGVTNIGISEQWFKNATNLTTANYFMANCSTFISKDIPEKMFEGCTSLTNVEGFFEGCIALECTIPRGLFDSCRGTLSNVARLFYNCNNLTGELPVGKYSTTTGVTGYEIVSKETEGAYQVVISPTDFSKQVSLEQVTLTSPELKEQITTNGTTYVKPKTGTITTTIDHGFLADCLRLTTTSAMFAGCQRITGAIPHDIFHTESATDRYLDLKNVSYMFQNMFKLNKPYRDVTNVDYICNENLLAKCPSLTTVCGLFYRLSGMPACNIYQGMFKNQSAIEDASYLFFLTSQLTGDITKNFLSTCLSKLKYANNMFDCCNMTNVNQGFLIDGTKNIMLRRVGCIFHGNFDQSSFADGACGTSPEFWNKNIFPNIETDKESGYHHALAGCTKLTNYAAAAAQAEGKWVSGRSH